MGTITAVEPQRRDESRVNIFIDGAFVLGTTTLLAHTKGLTPGRDLTADELEELVREDRVERAYSAALNFLSYRPRSAWEVDRYFHRKGIGTEVTEEVVARLQRTGLLNDADFARFWVENRQTFRPRGSHALRVEMRRKGLSSDVIEEVLQDAADEEDTAYRAACARVRTYRGLDEVAFFRKMMAFLQRRGFPYEPAASATRRLYAELSSSAEVDGDAR